MSLKMKLVPMISICLYIQFNVAQDNNISSLIGADQTTLKSENSTEKIDFSEKDQEGSSKEVFEELEELLEAEDLPDDDEASGMNEAEETNSTSFEPSTTDSTTTSTTTTATTTTTKSPSKKASVFKYSMYCTCDLLVDLCDVNCCCDKDCGRLDRLSFSKCVENSKYKNDQRYCYSSELMFTNNAQYAVEQVSESLLCIVTDNLEERNRYVERAATENLTEFTNMEARHNKFTWSEETKPALVENYKHYKAGNPLWIQYSDNTLGHLQIPAPGYTGACHTLESVKFMLEKSSKCPVYLDGEDLDCTGLRTLNGNNFFKNFQILSEPSLFNPRVNTTELDNPYIEISSYICRSENPCPECLEPGTFCPQYNLVDKVPEPTQDCKNIVESVHYNIFHSGVEGINAIDAFIKLTNLTKPNFHQTFSYRSFWSQDNKTTTSPRSGNPGYLVGKPVLSGSMNTSTAGEYFIDDQVEAGRKLTLFVPGSNGKCDFNARAARSPILFGENVKLGCSVYLNRTEISQSCTSLKNKSFQMLNGVQFQQMTENYVATFGNSQPNQTWDWVKVLIVDLPNYGVPSKRFDGRCNNVVTSLNIEVVYASIGSLYNPQNKIVGVAYTFGRPKDIIFKCTGFACNHRGENQRIDFSVSVKFTDVTQPALPQYAEYPVIEAKFPRDFFYPFVSSTAASQPGGVFLMWLFVLFYIYKSFS